MPTVITYVVNKNVHPWTLGNYLALLKKSPLTVTIGVAYVIEDCGSSGSEESETSKGANLDKPVSDLTNRCMCECCLVPMYIACH